MSEKLGNRAMQNRIKTGWVGKRHRISAFREFHPEPPVPARPIQSRYERNVSAGELHRFTSNMRVATLTTRHGWKKVLSRALRCKFPGKQFLVHRAVNTLFLSFSKLPENAFLVHSSYLQLITEYLSSY